jgi:glycogen synthase
VPRAANRSRPPPPAGPFDVLHITSEFPPLHFGGLGVSLAGLVSAADRAGARVSVLLVDPGAGGYGSPASGYGRYSGYGSYGRGSVSGSSVLGGAGGNRPTAVVVAEAAYEQAAGEGIRLVAEGRHSVIHLHSSWLWPIASEIRSATGVPILYTLHSIDRVEIEAGEWIPHGDVQDAAVMGADTLVVLSKSERRNLLRHYPHAGRIRVIGNGIECGRLQGDLHRLRDSNGRPKVLYVGRFASRKGIHELLAALPLILGRYPSTEFVMVGGGSPYDSGRQAATWLLASLRGDRRVRFVGWQPEADRYYRSCDILVVPSRYEPFGMVILEGMRAGIAIAATSTGGPSEILQDGVTGVLFPPRDVDGIVDAVGSLIAHPRLRRRLGDAAAEDARRRWSWSSVYARIDEAYRDTVAAPLTRRRSGEPPPGTTPR